MPNDSSQPNTLPTALVAGATGLVGRALIQQLARDPGVGRIRALVRKPLAPDALSARVESVVADFNHLEAQPSWFAADWVFCALGSTIRQAGSQAAFRQVDFEYPLAIAKLAQAQGAKHFLLVSAVGADAHSPVFYNRVKGEIEQALRSLGYASLTIARPSLLQGPRAEFRFAERVLQPFGWLAPAAWKPVHVDQVAAALLQAAHRGRAGVEVLDNVALHAAPR